MHTFLQKCSPTLRIFGVFNAKKARKVYYVSRKSGPKSQADRSVRQADSAGRLEHVERTNKAMGVGFQRKGGRHLPAENMGIFCVSRIFVGDTGVVCTSLMCHLQPPLSFGRPFGFSDLRTSSEFSDKIRKFCTTFRFVCTLRLNVVRRQCGKERKKETKIYKNIRLSKILI